MASESPRIGAVLAALALALLFVAPVALYPAKALGVSGEQKSVLDLNARVTEHVIANLSKTHGYISALASLAKLAEELSNDGNSGGLEALDNNIQFNVSKVLVPAIMFESSNPDSKIMEYVYRYILLKNTFDFNQFAMNFNIEWSDNHQPVTYNPASPEDSVFGGMLSHKVEFAIHKNPPTAMIDPGAGNAEELVQLFMEHSHFDVYMLTYKLAGDTFNVGMEKHVDGDTVTVKDYSLYYGVVIKATYDEQLMNALDAIKPKDGSYVYFAVANVSFTVNLQPGQEKTLARTSTWDMQERRVDITPYVKAALNILAGQISQAAESAIPQPVKHKLLQEVQNWSLQSYWIRTRHIVERISFTWVILDTYNVYDSNLSNIGGATQVVLSGSHDENVSSTAEEDLVNEVVSMANETLAQYYPGGIKAFTYTPQGQPKAILMYNTETTDFTPLPAGQSGPVLPVTNASLFFTAYPLDAGNGHKMTDVTANVKVDSTSDYAINVRELYTAVQYNETYTENNETYLITHLYTLYFNITPSVVEAEVSINAMPYNLVVNVEINPIIIGKKVQVVAEGNSRLIPALAPLGGTGVFDMVQGGASEINLDSVVNAVNVVKALVNNSNFNWVLPTYFPLPMPSDSLRIFAPGEYIGAYYMTQKIRLGGGDGLSGFLSSLGKPLFSIMYEKVSLTLKSPGAQGDDDPSVGIVEMSKGKIKRDSSDEIKLYSLGFGVGEIKGKVIGPRFYATPSSTGMPGDTPPGLVSGFLNSSIVEFLTGDNFITDLLDDVLPGEVFTAAKDIVEHMRDNGLYPQITTYFAGGDSVWPYFMFSPKNTERFVVTRPGDYIMRANAEFNMLHIRIFKVPILGIPIPIPVFVSHGETANTSIHVRQIKALPLLVNYVINPPSPSSGGGNGPIIRPLNFVPNQFGEGSYIGIYAVPVWVDLDGVTPLGPVLFRGQYGTGENSTSLTIAVVSPYGNVINGTDVRFFGVPLSFVRVPLNELERVVSGPEGSLVLMAAWKHGRTVSTIGSPGAATVLRVARVKSFSLFFYDGKMITYTGVYDPYNKIHEFAKQIENRVDYYAGVVQGYLGQANSTLLQIIGQINNIEGLLGLLNSTSGDINKILMNISQEIVNTIMSYMGDLVRQLINQFVANAVAAVIGAVVPDPTGVISGYIQEIIQQLIQGALSNLLPNNGGGQINITDLITNYGLQILTFVALKVAYQTIGYQGLMNMLEQVKGVAMKGIDMITRVNQSINYILKIVNNTVEMTKYKPIVLSKLNVYSLRGQEVPSEGILAKLAGSRGEHLILPIDAVEVNLSGGGVLYASPYSTLTFVLQLVAGAETGEYPNVAVSVQDALLYVAAWANFLAGLLGDNGGEALTNIYNTLIQWSGQITNVLSQVQQWVEIPGIDTHTILLPSTTLVPPSKI